MLNLTVDLRSWRSLSACGQDLLGPEPCGVSLERFSHKGLAPSATINKVAKSTMNLK